MTSEHTQARRVVAFEPLIPAGVGDAPPCRASVDVRGERGGETLSLSVMDLGIALQALRSGGWALEALEAAVRDAQEAHVPASSTGLATSAPLEAWLVARGLALRRDLVRVESFGEMDDALRLNGLVLTSEPIGVLDRAGVLCWEGHSSVSFAAHLDAWRAGTRGVAPERAPRIEIRGAAFFDEPARVSALLDRVSSGPWLLRTLVWSGDAEPAAFIAALRAIVVATLRSPSGSAPRLVVGEDAHADVRRIAEHVSAIDLGAFSALARLYASDERLARTVDDAARAIAFRALAAARADPERRRIEEPRVLERVVASLGPAEGWVRPYRRAASNRAPRVVVIPTWQCELRCRYCTIPKQDGRVMPLATLERAIDLLLSSDARECELHFFGGEPFMEWPTLKHAVEWGTARAREEGRTIRFLFTTNAWGLTKERLAFLAQYPVWFQLSLDGDPETQEASRPARGDGSSYDESPGGKASWILAAKVPHDVVQVVHPRNVARMAENFRHILGLGYRRVQLNYALGTWWEPPAITAWANGLMEIGEEVRARAAAGQPVELVNLEETLLTVRGSLEITIDWDGTVFGSTAFLVLPKRREKFALGHLDDARSFSRYVHEGFPMEHLLANWFGEGMAENNQAVGGVLTSFVRWWRERAASASRDAP